MQTPTEIHPKNVQKFKTPPEIRATSRFGPQWAPLSDWCLPGASGMASPRGANERKPCKKQTRTIISKRQPYRVRAVHPNRGEAKLCCLKHVCIPGIVVRVEAGSAAKKAKNTPTAAERSRAEQRQGKAGTSRPEQSRAGVTEQHTASEDTFSGRPSGQM